MKGQITKTLPRNDWDKVVIHENNDPLLELKETERIKIGLVKKDYESLFFVRKTVAEKLQKVSLLLPAGINLVIIEGYRTMQSQQHEWDSVFKKIKSNDESLTDEEVEVQARLVVAKPSPLSNHHCGGAVDISLIYDNGILVDMGTNYISASSIEDKIKFPMLSDKITEEQKKNRKILRDVMETENFVWYPGEWWHYCWGDRMWAVYTNQTECYYGPIELE
ncbi:MAG: D-alanyl-D-alanine carboxypeptidase family protein [Candidatus Nomurabacteria bacterium]|nr:D-alanyl-D-alanine carboxypeptidase family protein [Candidatus Nomurabacteria bacterium]